MPVRKTKTSSSFTLQVKSTNLLLLVHHTNEKVLDILNPSILFI